MQASDQPVGLFKKKKKSLRPVHNLRRSHAVTKRKSSPSPVLASVKPPPKKSSYKQSFRKRTSANSSFWVSQTWHFCSHQAALKECFNDHLNIDLYSQPSVGFVKAEIVATTFTLVMTLVMFSCTSVHVWTKEELVLLTDSLCNCISCNRVLQ